MKDKTTNIILLIGFIILTIMFYTREVDISRKRTFLTTVYLEREYIPYTGTIIERHKNGIVHKEERYILGLRMGLQRIYDEEGNKIWTQYIFIYSPV
ncbi:hypothetical protein [Fusobacterium ulcerans]|uniref:hypothetical protein n=1 Tax=Fusobacterium ulcerans TaxID=861 RepID=UPI001D0B3F78|nr:hypothetical protein [Fusobacterium ulcerans]MCB8563883.1 hypothetical protein [Fusobacterium ulcerans]MCB8648277.1 hypothetical protein [Fusobacterium ulcerans]